MRKEIEDILEHQVGDARQCKLCDAVWIYFERNGNSGFLRLSNGPPSECPNCVNFDTGLMNRKDLIAILQREGKL